MIRKKLYEDLCAETDLDLSQTSGLDMPQYLQRSLFILENLAFFEYASVDERLIFHSSRT
jgi:cohesin loading factor subunit SCC2